MFLKTSHTNNAVKLFPESFLKNSRGFKVFAEILKKLFRFNVAAGGNQLPGLAT